MSQTIRPAEPMERPLLEALQLRASLATGEHVSDLLAHPEAAAIDPAHIPHTLVLELGGRVAGFCIVLPVAPEVAELEGLFVEPDCWRMGKGADLVGEAEAKARGLGASSLHVVAGEWALPFYRALGFELLGAEVTRFGPAFGLHKALFPRAG